MRFISFEFAIVLRYPLIFLIISTMIKMIRNTISAATIIPNQNPALKMSAISSQPLIVAIIKRKMAE